MEYTYLKTSVSKEKLSEYSKLLSAVFTDTKKYTPEFLDWQYNQNPSGKVVGYDAYYNDELIAHYVALPVEYLYNDQLVRGLLALNVATHIDHRGKSLFTKLAAMTYAYGEELGYKFVTGVANQNTTSGYLKRLGFEVLAPLEVKIFFGTPVVNQNYDAFFREVWTPEKVKWRINNPENKYHLTNQCIMSETHISLIHAVLSERQEFKNEKLQKKNSLLKMSIGLNLKNSKKILSFKLPDRFKPSPLNLIFKTLGGYKMDVKRTNTFFELIDFDAY